MSPSPFDPTFEDLPDVLPIFPLTGVLLLPSTRMPLHVFEPRYRAMIEDALAEGSPIGMIQPMVPADDNGRPTEGAADEVGAAEESPELYRIGCAGTIESAQQLDGGRWLVLLQGARRFRVESELPLRNGYRRVVADWRPFAHDGSEVLDDDSTALLVARLERYGRQRSLDLDLDTLSELPGITLLHGIAAALPFSPAERQALLEASDAAARLQLLLDLLAMEEASGPGGDTEGAPN